MFLPDQGALEEKRQAEEQRKQAYRQIENRPTSFCHNRFRLKKEKKK